MATIKIKRKSEHKYPLYVDLPGWEPEGLVELFAEFEAEGQPWIKLDDQVAIRIDQVEEVIPDREARHLSELQGD